MRKLLIYTSLLELSLGVCLLLIPLLVLNLLLGIEAAKATDAIGHLAGIVYLCFGYACYPSKDVEVYKNNSPVVKAMFTYNLLAGIYLGYLKFAGGFEGVLLLPASVLHILITIYFIIVMTKDKKN